MNFLLTSQTRVTEIEYLLCVWPSSCQLHILEVQLKSREVIPFFTIKVVIPINGWLLAKWDGCPINKSYTSWEALGLHYLRKFKLFFLSWPRCQMILQFINNLDHPLCVQVDCSIANTKEILESIDSCPISIRAQATNSNGKLNWRILLGVVR